MFCFFRRGSSSWSVRSWDSHAHYQDYPDEEDGDEGGLGGGGNGNEDGQDNPEGGLYPSSIRPIVCYCDMSTFKTPRTILRVLLVVRRKLIYFLPLCLLERSYKLLCWIQHPRFTQKISSGALSWIRLDQKLQIGSGRIR